MHNLDSDHLSKMQTKYAFPLEILCQQLCYLWTSRIGSNFFIRIDKMVNEKNPKMIS